MVSALESVVVTEQHQMCSERRAFVVLGSPRLSCGRRGKSSFEESGLSIRKKRRMSSAIEGEECDHWMVTKTGMLGGYGFQRQKREERDHWMGTKIGMFEGYEFQRQVTAGDGSDNKGRMGAGCNNLRGKKNISAKWHKRKRA